MKCNRLNHIDICKAQKIIDTVFLVIAQIWLLEHLQIKTLSPLQQTLLSHSIEVPKETMIKKDCFHQNLLLIWLSYLLTSITLSPRNIMTLKTLLTPHAVFVKYYDKNQIQTLQFSDKYKCFSLFHINACS